MPEGPFGFPRLFGIGPLTQEEFQDPDELLRDIRFRGHSYRNYDPDEFMYLANSDISKPEIRDIFRIIEAGRFDDMLKETYDFWVPLDIDEKETFAKRNPELIEWLEVRATLEEVRRPSEDIEL